MSFIRQIFSLALFIVPFLSFSQNCTPDQTITKTGFSPANIEDAKVGKVYKQVLQIRVFKDTVVVIAGNPTLATIDSIKVNDIIGLPSGFYYTCSRKNCSFIPDSTGCATLNGNPSASQVGEYPLGVAIEVYAKIFGSIQTTQKDTVRQFTVNVVDESSVEWQLYMNSAVCYPNPTTNGHFNFNKLYINQIETITCHNTLGETINTSLNQEGFSLDTPCGFYFATIRFKTGHIITEKILLTF